MPLGPTIGKLPGQGRSKNHSSYRKDKKQEVLTLRTATSGASGFLWVEARAVHDPTRGALLVTLSARRRGDNLAPSFILREVCENWHRHHNSDGSLHKTVSDLLAARVALIESKQYPERGMFIETCNTTGQEPGAFLEDTCTRCRSWYCDLSTSRID